MNAAARLLVGFGVAMVVLGLAIRPAIQSPQGLITDTVVLIVGGLMVLTGVVAIRIDVKRRTREAADRDDLWR